MFPTIYPKQLTGCTFLHVATEDSFHSPTQFAPASSATSSAQAVASLYPTHRRHARPSHHPPQAHAHFRSNYTAACSSTAAPQPGVFAPSPPSVSTKPFHASPRLLHDRSSLVASGPWSHLPARRSATSCSFGCSVRDVAAVAQQSPAAARPCAVGHGCGASSRPAMQSSRLRASVQGRCEPDA